MIPTWLASPFLPVILAPAIGSFLGVLIRRLPAGRPIAAARSACESCGTVLRAGELVPLLSYLAQRGMCRRCGAPIGAFHPAIELAALCVALAAAFTLPPGPILWAGCIFGWWLLALAWIDAETMRLPDALTLPLILAGLAEGFWADPARAWIRAAAAAGAYASLWALAAGYRLMRKREGLGMGDAKLLAAGGAWLGPVPLPMALVTACLLALIYAVVLRLLGREIGRTTRIPLGPFLAAGLFGAWLLTMQQRTDDGVWPETYSELKTGAGESAGGDGRAPERSRLKPVSTGAQPITVRWPPAPVFDGQLSSSLSQYR